MVLSFSCYNSLGGEVVRGVLRAGCRADPRTGSKAPVEAALGTEKDKYNYKYKFRSTTWQRQLGLQPESPGRAFLPSTAAQSPGRNAWERWEK